MCSWCHSSVILSKSPPVPDRGRFIFRIGRRLLPVALPDTNRPLEIGGCHVQIREVAISSNLRTSHAAHGIGADPDRSTDVDPTLARDPDLASTEPSTRPDDVETEVLNYVHLDPPRVPGSIGAIAHYEVFNVVGQGAMGVVVRAYDTQLCRTVAIKLMSPQLTLIKQARERFFREARAAAGINHPNIVTIHAVSEHAGVPFLVMEFVGGRSLSDRIHSDAPLSCLDALRISVQIASGLAAAHSQGIIHRDIKPANIMLEDSIERVKITDFGLARVMMEQSELTSQGGVVGTPAYMSPEQVNGEPLDQRSDLFSLGCVMYAMTAGYSPFRGENVLGTARRVANVKHESLAAISKDVPPYFIQVVDRLLEKAPADRYQSASELVEELTRHLVRANSGAGPQPEVPAAASSSAWSRWVRWVALFLLFLSAAALLAEFRERSPWRRRECAAPGRGKCAGRRRTNSPGRATRAG